jgi:hypothetical protein
VSPLTSWPKAGELRMRHVIVPLRCPPEFAPQLLPRLGVAAHEGTQPASPASMDIA